LESQANWYCRWHKINGAAAIDGYAHPHVVLSAAQIGAKDDASSRVERGHERIAGLSQRLAAVAGVLALNRSGGREVARVGETGYVYLSARIAGDSQSGVIAVSAEKRGIKD
jgi:hypothetical protein